MLLYNYERKGIWMLVLLIVGFMIIPQKFLQGEQDLFLLAEDKIPLPDSLRVTPRKTIPMSPIELNTADSISLIKLKGIGPYYASKIIKYRKRLGGYYAVRQLKELNMTYFNLDSCAHFFTVNPALIIKKDLNQMTFKEVLHHPYLEYEDVKLIFNSKNKYKVISFDTLKNRNILPDYLLKKIKHYFK